MASLFYSLVGITDSYLHLCLKIQQISGTKTGIGTVAGSPEFMTPGGGVGGCYSAFSKRQDVTSENLLSSQLGNLRKVGLRRKELSAEVLGKSSDSTTCSPKAWLKTRLGDREDNRGLRKKGW